MKICSNSKIGTMPLLAAAAGVVAFSASDLNAQEARLQFDSSWSPSNAAQYTPHKSDGGVAGAGFCPGAGDPDCLYDNGAPVDCPGAPASQLDLPYPFLAEAADDFTLVGSPENPCRLTCLTFWVSQFNGTALDPATAWSGVQVTIYPDDGGEPKEPGGDPIDDDGTGVPSHSGAVIAVQQTLIDVIGVELQPMEDFPANDPVYRIDVPIDIVVPKNFKMWIAIAPIAPSFPQTALVLSDTNTDNGALQNFPLIDDPLGWDSITGATDCPPSACPYDCQPAPEGSVATPDLLELLAQWGGPGSCDNGTDGMTSNGVVDTVDLLALLAAWGDCPPASEDKMDIAFRLEGTKEAPQPGGPPYLAQPENRCSQAVDVSAGGPYNLDLKGATTEGLPANQFWPPECTTNSPDVWYCYTAAGPGNLSVSTDADVFIEITEGCTCPPSNTALACGRGGPFQPALNVFVDTGQSVAIRVINDAGYPDSVFVKGTINVDFEPGLLNQECDNATPLVVDDAPLADDTTASSGTLFATEGCPAATFIQNTSGLWYEVVGPGPGDVELTVNVCTPLADPWDTVASVYCGECDLSITNCTKLTCIDSANLNDACGGDLNSTVTWCSAEGETYRILVHANTPGEDGPFTIEVVSGGACGGAAFCGIPAPDNDECEDAELIALAGTTTVPLDTTCATASGQAIPAGLCNNGIFDHDVWYYVTVPAGAVVLNASTCSVDEPGASADFDSMISMYGPYNSINDADCQNLIFAVCNDEAASCGAADTTSTARVVDVTAGEVYLIRVGGFAAGDRGTGALSVYTSGTLPVGACCTADGSTCTDAVDIVTCEAGGGLFVEDEVCANVEPCPALLDGQDSCADAGLSDLTPLINGADIQSANTSATPPQNDGGPGDPELPPGSPSCQWAGNPTDMHNTVWYSVDAPASGDLTITFCDGGDLFQSPDFNDSTVVLFDGACGALVEAACAEDECGAPNYLSTLQATGLTPGQTYIVVIGNPGGWGGSTPGTFVFRVTDP